MKSTAEPERVMVDLSAPSSPLPHVSDSQGGSDEFKALYYQEQMAHQKLKAEVNIFFNYHHFFLVFVKITKIYILILSFYRNRSF